VKNILTKNTTRNTRVLGLSMKANNNFIEKYMVDYQLEKKLIYFCVPTTKTKFKKQHQITFRVVQIELFSIFYFGSRKFIYTIEYLQVCYLQ
jgi:hypothetical protein